MKQNGLDSAPIFNWANTVCKMNINDTFTVPTYRTPYAKRVVDRENQRALENRMSMEWDFVKSRKGGVIVRVR